MSYTIIFRTPNGDESTFECEEDQHLLDAAEDAGVDAPSSCRAGACSTCCGKVVEGTVDASEQFFLDDEQLEEGYILTCVTYPTSNCTVLTNQEEEL